MLCTGKSNGNEIVLFLLEQYKGNASLVEKTCWFFCAFAAPLRYLARRKGMWENAYPVGFARAESARFTHGYVLAAANVAHINH